MLLQRWSSKNLPALEQKGWNAMEGRVQEGGISNAFRQLSEAQLDQYRQLMPADDDAAVDIVSSVLGLDNPRKDTRQHLHWSMTARALNFAIDRKFSNTKTGILFNIVQTLLQSIRQGDSRDSCELRMLQPMQ